ncbi:MAG: mechanosensitive ion channel domain-containing protein [Candidatus Korobacteraceae bacterium]
MSSEGTNINYRAHQLRAVYLLLCVLVVLAPASLAASSLLPSAAKASDKDPSAEPATIEFWNRPIATLRSSLAGADPQDRAERAASHLNQLPLTARAADIELHPIKVEDEDGIGFTSENGTILFFLGTGDLDKESGETLASASKAALQRLDEALLARESERSWPVIRKGLLFTLLGLALLVLFWWLVWKAYHFVFDYLHERERTFPYRMRFWGIEFLPHLAGALYTLLKVAAWLFTLGALYSWLTVSLGHFPYTEPWGKQLGGYVFHFFGSLGVAAVNALPGIFSCIVIFLITRWVIRLGKAFFRQVSSGALRLSWMDPDVAQATERIFTFGAWVFAVVVAYPYIPGSSTEAFKGISVFFGVVVSLGSTGIINQVMSGLFVVYSKALKSGDWVVVNDKEGQVLEVGLLAVKIRTIEEQEVTIPNSVIVTTTTTNFTRLGKLDGSVANVTVTIGYDAPWRQVHALLLLGAERTANLRKAPAPYVVQRALSDFYVEYTLILHLESERLRIETLSSLHANIQDAFNEFGVQIMSPHFMMQPQQNVVVDRSNWYAAPAPQKNGEPGQSGVKHFEAGK